MVLEQGKAGVVHTLLTKCPSCPVPGLLAGAGDPRGPRDTSSLHPMTKYHSAPQMRHNSVCRTPDRPTNEPSRMLDTIAGLSAVGPMAGHKQDVTLLCEEFPQRENGRMETIYQNERRALTASRTDVVLCIFDHLKIHWSIICTFVCWWIHYLERRS